MLFVCPIVVCRYRLWLVINRGSVDTHNVALTVLRNPQCGLNGGGQKEAVMNLCALFRKDKFDGEICALLTKLKEPDRG